MKQYLALLLIAFFILSCQGDRLISSLDAQEENNHPETHKVWGFLDSKGHVAIPLRYQEVRGFHQGRAAFRSGNLWGYLDTAGIERIKAAYLQAHSFSDNLARVVTKEGRTIFIDKEGKSAFPLHCSRAGNFNNKRAPFWKDNKVGYINPLGKVVIAPRYDDGFSFQGSFAIVKQGQMGIIDQYGSFILPPKYKSAYRDPTAKEAIYLITTDTSTRYFNAENKRFIPHSFTGGKAFYRSNAVAQRDSLFGAINAKGEWVVLPIFSELINLGESRWALQYEGDYFMIDSTGLQQGEGFKQIYRFSEGLAIAQIDRLWGFVDTSGAFVIQPIYELVRPFKHGIARVVTEDGVGFINHLGHYIIQPLQGDVREFHEGYARFNVTE